MSAKNGLCSRYTYTSSLQRMTCQEECMPACIRSAYFDIVGGTGSYCAKHIKEGMIDVKNKHCEHDDCNQYASFGFKGKARRFCGEHSLAGMVQGKNRMCVCGKKQATHNYHGEWPPLYCAEDALESMINVKSKRCEYEGCTSIDPSYGYANTMGTRCSTHKLENMVDVRHKMCEECGTTRAGYGFLNEKPLRCKKHILEGMVDITHKMCNAVGCMDRPSFGVAGTRKALKCAVHKDVGMVDVVHNICETEGCDERATYDIPSSRKERFCFEHKQEGMTEKRNRVCEMEGCEKQARYGFSGNIKQLCALHGELVKGMFDLSKRTCQHEKCDNTPTVGVPGKPTSRCKRHALCGMIERPNGKCKHCKELATWGINMKAMHCETHKQPGESNLSERECVSCKLLYVLDAEGYCQMCHPRTVARTHLSKQRALFEYLDSKGLAGTTTDKSVNNAACGRERPDRVYDFEYCIIIVECDEHQHSGNACECEQVRMVNISQAFGGIPVYFIRWNPDEYSVSSAAKKGKNNESLRERYKLLEKLLADIQNRRISLPTSLLAVFYMYYDGWSSFENEKWEIITTLHN